MKTGPKKKLELKPVDGHNNVNLYELYIDGQLVSEHGYEHSGEINFDDGFRMTVKKDLNFDAECFLDKLHMHLDFPEEDEDCRVMFDMNRKGDKIQMFYFISFDMKELLNMDVNPIKLLKLFLESVEKKGFFKTAFIEDGLDLVGAGVSITLPAQGNIAAHYIRHMDVFEKLFQKAGAKLGDDYQTLFPAIRRALN